MTTKELTDFRQRIEEALQTNADYARLRAIIDQYYATGCTKAEAYEILESVWTGYGFHEDDHDEPNHVRDELEYAMEQVWYWDQ